MNKENLCKIIKRIHLNKENEIRGRIEEFRHIGTLGSNEDIFFELVYCMLAAGTSAELAFKVHNILRKDDFIISANQKQIIQKLKTCYRFYNLRGEYIYQTREYFRKNFNFDFKKIIKDNYSLEGRRDFFAEDKNIIGIGMKVASHFLRNIGFMEYAILDKHVIQIMKEFNLISDKFKISNKMKYIECELVLRELGEYVNLTMGELDFVLWYYKTGKIIK